MLNPMRAKHVLLFALLLAFSSTMMFGVKAEDLPSNPINVKVGVLLVNVEKVDLSASSYRLDFYLWFEFDPSWSTVNFFLTDGEGQDSGPLAPGTYSVLETVPAGWDLTSVTKNGTAFTNGGSIVLGSGQTWIIVYTNTQRGKIIVDKVTVPANDPQSFDFAVTGPGGYSQSFSLTDAATPWDSGWIKPGTYAASETVPAGWDLTSAVCSDGSPVNAIDLNPGETVTVTFTNKLLIRFLKEFTDSGALNGFTKPLIIDPITSKAYEIKTGPAIWWNVTYTVKNEDTEGHYYILWDKWGGNLLILDSKPTGFDATTNIVTLANSKSFAIDYAGYSGYIGSGLTLSPSKGTAVATLHTGDQQQGTNPGKGKGTSKDGKAYDVDIRWEIGWLNPGETATLTIYVAPGKNPGGQLQFSSYGTYVINTGPRVRAYLDLDNDGNPYENNEFVYSWDFTNQLTVIVQKPV
ncbi:MAG: DUF5979 domain-containing protein [Candidatus Bathyarchaeia archaeon]